VQIGAFRLPALLTRIAILGSMFKLCRQSGAAQIVFQPPARSAFRARNRAGQLIGSRG
jgi:hypothetical protein